MNATTLPYATRHHGQAAQERKRWSYAGRLIRRIPDAIHLWYERKCQREILARLNDRLLNDVGLGRDDFMQAVRKPFWRL
jgi:uncharacterized protein YjiS (DUF1127 family)